MDIQHRGYDDTGQPAATIVQTRVLVVGTNSFPDSMEAHVVEALTCLGCTVEFVSTRPSLTAVGQTVGRVLFKLANTVLREPERMAERRLLNAVSRFDPSLVLVILGNHVSPKSVALMRKITKAPIVCWCQDQMTTLGRQYVLGAGYDAVFVKDRYMQDLFARMIRSTAFYYLPEACNPRVHRTVELTDSDRERYGCEVMIAGSLYYYRQEILRELREFDLKVWGGTHDWMIDRLPGRHRGRDLFAERKARAVRAARLALNPLHFAEIDALNCRTFELAGCGAMQLVNAKPVLSQHFTPGAELDTFASVEELIEKIRHYLAHPEQAAEIAQRGQLRAHREHTYERRLVDILRVALG